MGDNGGDGARLLVGALPPLWEHQVRAWLQEDVPGFDIGGFVVGGKSAKALTHTHTHDNDCMTAALSHIACSGDHQNSIYTDSHAVIILQIE